MIKRIADFFEKFSVAALAVGLFQGKALAIVLGCCSFAASMLLTRWLKGKSEL